MSIGHGCDSSSWSKQVHKSRAMKDTIAKNKTWSAYYGHKHCVNKYKIFIPRGTDVRALKQQSIHQDMTRITKGNISEWVILV